MFRWWRYRWHYRDVVFEGALTKLDLSLSTSPQSPAIVEAERRPRLETAPGPCLSKDEAGAWVQGRAAEQRPTLWTRLWPLREATLACGACGL